MHFVDRHRLLAAAVSCFLPAAGHPFPVGPAEASEICYHGSIVRTKLCTICIRIGFHQNLIGTGQDLVLVNSPRLYSRNKQLIYPGYLQRTHRMKPAIPHIEITHNTHSSGVRCPYREVSTLDAIDLHRMRSQLIKDLIMLSLCKKIKIQAGNLWCKAVRICCHYHVILTVFNIQKIRCL